MATLPGTLVIYYGDEIGMTDVDVPPELQLDEMRSAGHRGPTRDRCRTPMQWSREGNAGFCPPSARPWLPLGNYANTNVHDQDADPASVLNFWRHLAALRRQGSIGGDPPLETLYLDDQVWAYRSGAATTVANLSPSPAHARLPGPAGRVVASTLRKKEGSQLGGSVSLGPWEALAVR
jgi:alpha-glucosidase